LIRCHLSRGEPAAAASVYRRLRRTLTALLGSGSAPTPATDALMVGIPDGAAPPDHAARVR
jgi:hypothetical protein